MSFQALDLSLDMIRALREPVAAIRMRDADLADQLKRAASSVPLNLAEGRRRAGKDRVHHWRVAAGSANEVIACLRVAAAWGHVDEATCKEAMRLCDRVLAILWTLSR